MSTIFFVGVESKSTKVTVLAKFVVSVKHILHDFKGSENINEKAFTKCKRLASHCVVPSG